MAPARERLLPRRVPKKSTFQDCYTYEVPGLLAFRLKPEASNLLGIGPKKVVKGSSGKDVAKKAHNPCPVKKSVTKAKLLGKTNKNKAKKALNRLTNESSESALKEELKSELENSLLKSESETDQNDVSILLDDKEALNIEKRTEELQENNTNKQEIVEKEESKSESEETFVDGSNEGGKADSEQDVLQKCTIDIGLDKMHSGDEIEPNADKDGHEYGQDVECKKSPVLVVENGMCNAEMKPASQQNNHVEENNLCAYNMTKVDEKLPHVLSRPISDTQYWQPVVIIKKLSSNSLDVPVEKETEDACVAESNDESDKFIATLQLMKVSDIHVQKTKPVTPEIKVVSEKLAKPKPKLTIHVKERNSKSCTNKKGKMKQDGLHPVLVMSSTSHKKKCVKVNSKNPEKLFSSTVITRSAKKNKPKSGKLISVRFNPVVPKIETKVKVATVNAKSTQKKNIPHKELIEFSAKYFHGKIENADSLGIIENSDVLDEMSDVDPEGDSFNAELNNVYKESSMTNTAGDCDNMSWSSLQLLHLLKDLDKMRGASEKQCHEVTKLKRIVTNKDSEIRVLKYKLHCYESDKLHHILKEVITEARCTPGGEKDSNTACSIVDKLMAYAREKDLC